MAFAGALLELEKYFWFDRHVGASAGAIAAVLLSARYTPAELRDLLSQKNFRDFMDAPLWKIPEQARTNRVDDWWACLLVFHPASAERLRGDGPEDLSAPVRMCSPPQLSAAPFPSRVVLLPE